MQFNYIGSGEKGSWQRAVGAERWTVGTALGAPDQVNGVGLVKLEMGCEMGVFFR